MRYQATVGVFPNVMTNDELFYSSSLIIYLKKKYVFPSLPEYFTMEAKVLRLI